MVNLFTLLRNFWSRLISYLRSSQPKIKSGDGPIKEPVNECEQVKKQLQQPNTLLSISLFQVFTKYNQIHKQLNDTISEKESLNQAVLDLRQQAKIFERERNEAREVSTKLRLENTLLEQKVKELESHKKALIQELGGSLSGQDIEFITWEILIQKVKEVTNQLNQVIADNQLLIKNNEKLQQEKNVLKTELNQVKDNNTKLTQDNSQLRANKNSLESELRQTLDRIKPLERAKDKLEQEKIQLERKLPELDKVEFKLRRAEAEIEQLEKQVKELKQTSSNIELELKQEKSKIVPLEQKIKGLEQAKNQLDAEIKQEKAKVLPFEAKNKNLEQVRNQLETALAQEKSTVAILRREINNLSTVPSGGINDRGNTTGTNDELLREISQLNNTIKQLEERIKQLEKQPNFGSSGQGQEASNCYCDQPYILDDLDLLEQYNDLVYFVQESLSCSGIEELNYWSKTEKFYIELISRLCFIDTILITRIKLLESENYFAFDENNNHTFDISLNYPGKFLFWSNGEVRWELSSYINSKL